MDTSNQTGDDAAQAQAHMPPEETRRLCALAQAGDRDARNRVVEGNLGLVRTIAYAFANYGADVDDLLQEGAFGLMRAIETYDPTMAAFSTYANWWIYQAVTRAIDRHTQTIHLPVHMANRVRRIRRVVASLDTTSNPPTVDEIAAAAGLTPRLVRGALAVPAAPITLDTPLVPHDPQSDTLADSLPDADGATAEDVALSRVEARDLGARVRRVLSLREYRVIAWRFGLDGEAPHTLAACAKRLRMSRERVRQIEAGALTKLRSPQVLRSLIDVA